MAHKAMKDAPKAMRAGKPHYGPKGEPLKGMPSKEMGKMMKPGLRRGK